MSKLGVDLDSSMNIIFNFHITTVSKQTQGHVFVITLQLNLICHFSFISSIQNKIMLIRNILLLRFSTKHDKFELLITDSFCSMTITVLNKYFGGIFLGPPWMVAELQPTDPLLLSESYSPWYF